LETLPVLLFSDARTAIFVELEQREAALMVMREKKLGTFYNVKLAGPGKKTKRSFSRASRLRDKDLT